MLGSSALRHLLAPVLILTLAQLGSPPTSQAQTNRNVELLANMHRYPEYRGVWPYVHPDGREYAVLMTSEGASFVSLADPRNPVEVGLITSHYPYAEVRTYGQYVYMVTQDSRDLTADPSDAGLAIVDMRTPDQPHKVATPQGPISNAHSLEIDAARGLLYVTGEFLCNADGTVCDDGNMKIFSLADPERPALLATYPTYVHHIHIKGTLGYASLLNEGGPTATDGYLAILDLSDPTQPREISRIVTDRTDQHSSWTSEDGRYLYVANEVNRDGLTVWDVANPGQPRLLFTFEDLPRDVIHQTRVLGSTLYVSCYTGGFRVMDLRDPAWPVEFGYYDTVADPSLEGIVRGLDDVVPYLPSGIAIASDILTGLYVFRVAPAPYGIIRGVVREAPNGPPIAGAMVTVQPAAQTVRSGRDGRYAFAVPPGVSTLTVSTFAFETSVGNVTVGSNTDQSVPVALKRLPSGTLTGTVRNATSGPLAAAEIEILGTPFRAVTNAQGAYSVASVPEGTYDVRAARPGAAARLATASIARNRTSTLDFSLGGVVFYDDVESDRGWVLNDPNVFAASGRWERATPAGKVFCDDGQNIEPAQDHSLAPGTTCFTTQTFALPCVEWVGAVAGVVVLTSPPLDLSGIVDPRIGYWRWFQTAVPGVSTLARLIVRLSMDGGATWVTVDTYGSAKPAWEFAEVRVANFASSPGSVLLRFVVDNSLFDIQRPEVAIDDIAIYSGGAGGASGGVPLAAAATPLSAFTVGTPRPSPSRGGSEVEFALGSAEWVRAEVFDLRGRLVRTALDRELPSGRHRVAWDGRTRSGHQAASGVYWMVIRAGTEERRAKLVVVR